MIRLSPGSYRYLHIVDERFDLHGAAVQLFEDFHGPAGIWDRPLREWPGWSEDPGGDWGYRCRLSRDTDEAMELEVTARPGDGEVLIQAVLKNTGKSICRDIIGEACLNVRPFLWLDEEGEHMWIFTGSGPVQVKHADRLICDGRPRYVYHTFDENRRISGDSWEFPWGPKAFVDGCMTLEPITEGLIVASERALEKRQLFIGFAWDRVAYLWTNFANCVHCSPMFGDIAPGEQAVRRGKVYVGEDMESLVARYRKDFPGRGRPGKV